MNRRTVVLSSLALGLAGCARVRDSKLNPFNWFGRSRERETVALPVRPKDTRDLVAEVVSMTVEQIPTGAIVRATGRTPTQGWWQAELVEQPLTEDGVLVLEFRIFPPIERTDINTPQSREVTAAIHLSNIVLDPVREIVVQGAANARAARR
ncbi:hypothetical protein LHP98_00680 [Rhodobacter sp. Har01]|uniref:hypothetical protein n=1 Tax=Rhodobacter sp. Har01 TaxID=2883999 RepID=UPI001D07C088|nr:hypothetical protein [Rhodobacter sp. Har01]MCB6176641.1 hypothetical protein [Rhodobacter sp. Har01]